MAATELYEKTIGLIKEASSTDIPMNDDTIDKVLLSSIADEQIYKPQRSCKCWIEALSLVVPQ